jgi:drug/metabolite transporter (DMT)-like permease
MPERPAIQPVWLVVIAVVMWSTGGLFIKLTALDAYQVTFFRSLLAGLTVLLFVAITSRREAILSQLRINALGIFASIIYATLLFLFVWATKHTTAANAIFLQYTAPIYILILGPFIIGEKFHLGDLVTVIFCIAGMSLFFVGKLEIADYQGNLAALGSGIFLGLYIMLLKPVKSDKGRVTSAAGTRASLPAHAADIDAATVTDASASGSPPYAVGGPTDNTGTSSVPERGVAVPTPPVGTDGVVLSSDRVQVQSVEKTSSPVTRPSSPNPVITVIYGNFLLALVTLPSGIAAFPTITATDLGAVAFLGIFQIGVAYILFIKGVTAGTRPLDASIIGFIEPLLNPVWVFLFVGEQPSNWAILGGAIIVATVLIHTLRQYRTNLAQ